MVKANWSDAERTHFFFYDYYDCFIYDVRVGRCKQDPQYEQWQVVVKLKEGPGEGRKVKDLWSFSPNAITYIVDKCNALGVHLENGVELLPEHILGKSFVARIETKKYGWPRIIKYLSQDKKPTA